MKHLFFLTITDFKLIFRDPALRIFLVIPFLIYGIVLFGLHVLINRFDDVMDFIPYVLMMTIMQASSMFGFIYAMVFVHEKDIQVAKVYGVLPVTKEAYVISRLLIPIGFSGLFTLILFIIQPFYAFSFLSMILMTLLCSLVMPLLALAVSVFSKNKMEGMTWFKFFNLLIIIPIVAFFISRYSSFWGIIPTHWAFQTLHHLITGDNYLTSFFIGLIYMLVLLWVLIKRFVRVHFL